MVSHILLISSQLFNAFILGVTWILLTYDGPWFWSPIEELTLETNSSTNVFLPKPGLHPRPLPPAKLVFWGVLGISRWVLLILMQTYKSCKLKKHIRSLGKEPVQSFEGCAALYYVLSLLHMRIGTTKENEPIQLLTMPIYYLPRQRCQMLGTLYAY